MGAVIEGAAIEYEDKIIYIQQEYNAIFSFDLKRKKNTFIKMLETEKKHKPYRCAYRYGQYAWFLPWELDKILRIDLLSYDTRYYDIPRNNVKEYKLEEYCSSYPSFNIFSATKVTNELLFVVTVNFDSPFLLNLSSGEIALYNGIIDFGNELFWNAVSYGDNIYLIPYKGKRMLKLNYKTMEVDDIVWNFETAAYCGTAIYGNKIWFAPLKARKLLVYDIMKNTYNEIEIGIKNSDDSFHDIFFENEKMWLVPWRSNYILCYDVDNKMLNRIKKDSEVCFDYKTEFRRIESIDKLIFVTCRTGFVSVYDRDTSSFMNYEPDFDMVEIRKEYIDSIDTFKCTFKKCLYENVINEDIIDLNLFLKAL